MRDVVSTVFTAAMTPNPFRLTPLKLVEAVACSGLSRRQEFQARENNCRKSQIRDKKGAGEYVVNEFGGVSVSVPSNGHRHTPPRSSVFLNARAGAVHHNHCKQPVAHVGKMPSDDV